MSPITPELQSRAMTILQLHGGKATLDEIRAHKLIPSALVTEVMRALISGKRVVMEGESTYVVPQRPAAPSCELADTRPSITDPSAHRAQATVKPVSGSAEPKRRGRHKKPPAPRLPLKCIDCLCLFPAEEFDPIEPISPSGRKNRRLLKCCACGNRLKHRAVSEHEPATGGTVTLPGDITPITFRSPEFVVPVKTMADLVEKVRGVRVDGVVEPSSWERFITVEVQPGMLAYLKQIVATGLYGQTVAEAAQRLICDGICRALASGVLKLLLEKSR